MKKEEAIYKILLLISGLSILSGLYGVFAGMGFENCFFSIFIGLSLGGTAFLNKKRERKHIYRQNQK